MESFYVEYGPVHKDSISPSRKRVHIKIERASLIGSWNVFLSNLLSYWPKECDQNRAIFSLIGGEYDQHKEPSLSLALPNVYATL